MRRLGHVLLSLALAAAPAAGQEARLSIVQSLRFASDLQQTGRPVEALQITEILLGRDPADVGALIVASRSLRDMGRYDEAVASGRAAWDAASTDRERYGAAIVTAEALSSGGRRTLAGLWLRRAAEVAPDDRLRDRAIRDFRYVRSRNPVTTRLGFSVTPSDNINAGPTTNSFVIGGIEFVDPSAVPLSGLRFSVSADLGYRQDLESGGRIVYGLFVSADEHRLTGNAASVPGADADDYDRQRAEVSIDYRPPETEGAGRVNYGLALGRDWLGDNPLEDYAEARAVWSLPMDDGQGLSVRAALRVGDRKDNALRSSETISFGATYGRRVGDGDRISLGGTVQRVFSESNAIAHDAVSAAVTYSLGQPMAGGQLSASAEIGLRDYTAPLYSPEIRQDRSVGVTISYLASSLDWFGFAPTFDLFAERNMSNVSLFDTETLGLRIGVRSTF